jgi:hypothetical protein
MLDALSTLRPIFIGRMGATQAPGHLDNVFLIDGVKVYVSSRGGKPVVTTCFPHGAVVSWPSPSVTLGSLAEDNVVRRTRKIVDEYKGLLPCVLTATAERDAAVAEHVRKVDALADASGGHCSGSGGSRHLGACGDSADWYAHAAHLQGNNRVRVEGLTLSYDQALRLFQWLRKGGLPPTSGEIPLASIRLHPDLVGFRAETDDLSALRTDIAHRGVLTPVVVCPVPGEAGAYYMVSGRRRFRCAEQLCMQSIPAVIRYDLDPAKNLAACLEP